MKGLGLPSSVPDPHYGRGLGSLPPHPALREEIRETQFGLDHRRPPPHPSMIEEHLLAQYQEIQVLLGDNQRLAATHVALKQELEATQHELQRIAQYADSLHPDRDIQMGGLHEKSIKLEADLRGVEATRNELHLVRSDIKELTDAKQELTGRMKMMTQDLARYNTDLKQVPALKTEIETMTRDLQRARSAIEYEKKGYAENFEHGQVMEKKLFSMARELEKLRAEIAIAEKQSRTVPNLGNQAYNPNYNHPEAAYAGNPYPAGYGMTPDSGKTAREKLTMVQLMLHNAFVNVQKKDVDGRPNYVANGTKRFKSMVYQTGKKSTTMNWPPQKQHTYIRPTGRSVLWIIVGPKFTNKLVSNPEVHST
ncbi:Protein FLX-like 1 [Linum grandiflorum]